MISSIISRLVILIFGTLYPAYASWKAIRTKDVQEYVKWMMYWIVFAIFTSIETFSDILLFWVPLYYEIKVIFVIWLLSPITQGSSFLFRKFVHPQISKREKEIDSLITKTREKGYTTLMTVGTKGIRYATDIVVKTAVMGQSKIADHIRKSYSVSDLSVVAQSDSQRYQSHDQPDGLTDSDEELNNRIRDDREELELKYRQNKRRTKHTGDRQSPTSKEDLELSSVMEEDGDFEVIKEAPRVRVINTRSTTKSKTSRYSSQDASHYGTIRHKRDPVVPSWKSPHSGRFYLAPHNS